ncbi:MAG: hypothetical protein V3W33_06790 [Gammaproteobacteria bacterium]|jgi:hypothetical protein
MKQVCFIENFSISLWAVWLVLMFFAIAPCVLAGEVVSNNPVADCSVPPSLRESRPDPPGAATEVGVGIYMIDVVAVEGRSQAYTADFHIELKWIDPRLSAESLGKSLEGCKLSLGEVWDPAARIRNQRILTKRLEDTVTVDSEGNVTYEQRFIGELTAPMDFRDFPWDTQILPIEIISVFNTPEDVRFVLYPKMTGRAEDFSVTNWFMGAPTTHVGVFQPLPLERPFSRFTYELQARRDTTYYVWKLIVPLALIVFMAWTVFWIVPTEIGPRVGMSTAAILTLIFFQFRFSQILPQISYLTWVDYFMIGSTILVFLALGEVVLTTRLTQLGNESLAVRMNHWSRWLFGLAFALVIVSVFWL